MPDLLISQTAIQALRVSYVSCIQGNLESFERYGTFEALAGRHMDIQLHTLKNGMRLVHQRVPGLVAHCGVLINTGSRDETEAEHGMAHFIEHMLFKGTAKRKAYHILSRLEDVGGELNAYTTKEETAVHASFLKDDYERATEIISDVVFNSSFPLKEIEKEKDVVIEEINSYLDNPSELIFDDFEELVFSGEPIGRNILGSVDSVKSFTRDKLFTYIKKHYMTSQMVFCSVGNIPAERVIRLAEKHFGELAPSTGEIRQARSWQYRPSTKTKKMDTYQNHCIIGNIACNQRDNRRMGMFLLNNILGGPGMNSRLNLSLREKNGLAYNVESVYNPYSDTGLFAIYFGTDSQNLEKSISITMNELKKMREVRLGTVQLSRAKNQLRGYLARGHENHENLMLSLGKSLQVYDTIETIEEIYSRIDKVTAADIQSMAAETLDPALLSTLIYK